VDNIVDRGLVLIVDQTLNLLEITRLLHWRFLTYPDLSVDFLPSFQVLADRVLALGNLAKEFVLVDVKACLALTEVGRTRRGNLSVRTCTYVACLLNLAPIWINLRF
jgi:hypothetical protein